MTNVAEYFCERYKNQLLKFNFNFFYNLKIFNGIFQLEKRLLNLKLRKIVKTLQFFLTFTPPPSLHLYLISQKTPSRHH